MAKNVCVNKELISSEVNYLLSNLRNSIAFGGRLPYCVVYLANVRQASLDAIKEMGIKYEAAGRWGHRLYAPKKGTKLWEALFKGSKVLDLAKSISEAKIKAAAAAEKEKAEKKAAKEKAKAEKEKAAAKAAKEKAAAKAEKAKAKEKAAKEKAAA